MRRVAHWGTGSTGRLALQGIIGHPDLELVGLYVARPERAGLDAGELCGRPPTRILATNDVEELLALDFDCLSYFGDGSHIPDIMRCLGSGRDVVTTSLAGHILPHQLPESVRRPMEDACRSGASALFATGIEPGFASDLLPHTLLTVSDEIRRVHVQEIAHYGDYGVEAVFRAWGFGSRPGEDIPLFTGDTLVRLWGGVARQMAADLGVDVDGVRLVTESAVTDHDIDTACGPVATGTVAAVRFELHGLVGDEPFTILEHVNHVDPSVAPEWNVGVTGGDTVYRVLVEGRPDMTCTLVLPRVDGESHGLIATAMRAINAIPVLADAPPGIQDPLSVPPRPGRHLTLPQRPR